MRAARAALTAFTAFTAFTALAGFSAFAVFASVALAAPITDRGGVALCRRGSLCRGSVRGISRLARRVRLVVGGLGTGIHGVVHA
ncbi:MAG: hypothetical protein ACK5X1_07370, partial [Betaproteobacteria bacterium]